MTVDRRYWQVLILAIVVAVGCLVTVQIKAAHARSEGKKQAAWDAHLATQQSRAAAFLAGIIVPALLKPAGQQGGCHNDPMTRCFTSSNSPAQAMRIALRVAQPLGLRVNRLSCKNPSPLDTPVGQALKPPWTPCSADIGPLSPRGFSVVAFPMRAAKQTIGKPLAFHGTSVSFTAN